MATGHVDWNIVHKKPKFQTIRKKTKKIYKNKQIAAPKHTENKCVSVAKMAIKPAGIK